MIEFSEIQNSYYILPLVGFIVGLFGTMLGGGGGFFFLPILILLVRVPAQTAVITSLVATLPICIVGSLSHFHNRNIDFGIGVLFALAGIAGAFFGAEITSRISAEQLKISFGIYSVAIALNIVWDARHNKQAEKNRNRLNELSRFAKNLKSSFFGFLAGTITGTFGTSGTAPVLAGLFSLNIPLKKVIGTSLIVVLSNTIFAIGAHFLVGRIDLTLVYFLTTGSIIGALIGPRFLSKIKTGNFDNKVRYLYAALMVVLGILMLVK
jgi:uncharacterized membrane protein YfcA